MKSEPKYRKQVNQNGWMIKLQRLCFGEATPKFTGYCPFFWFTWLCLLLVVIILPLRLLLILFVYSIASVAELRSRRPSRPKDVRLLSFYDHYLSKGQNLQFERENNYHVWPDVFKWIDKTPDWENCAKEALIRRERARQAVAACKLRNAERSKKISKFAAWIGRPIKLMLLLVGLFASYKVTGFLYFIIRQITWHELLVAGKWLVIILLAVSAAVLLINSVKFSILWYRRCPRCPDKISWWRKAIAPIGKILGGIVEFIGDTIETIYTRECPLIEWGDESGPIEPNDF
jgi:hypothetical protein